MEKNTKKVILTVEQFANSSSSDIVKIMESNKAYAITGSTVGIDRHIIERKNY